MAKQSHTPSHFPALDRAIKKHQAALEALRNAPDDDQDDLVGDLVDDEIATRQAIAMRRFKSDTEFLAAMRYLVAAEAKLWRAAELDDDFGATIGAVANHFGVPVVYFGKPLS